MSVGVEEEAVVGGNGLDDDEGGGASWTEAALLAVIGGGADLSQDSMTRMKSSNALALIAAQNEATSHTFIVQKYSAWKAA